MRTITALLALALAGCATQQMAGGSGLPQSELATVHADPALSAGLPVQLRLRSADGEPVGLAASAVTLAPGPHQLVVDCRVLESGSTRRFTLDVELEPGGDYRLQASASSRNCEAVEIVAR